MAGSPASLASVQAAVLKSAAGAAGQGSASEATGQHQGAVSRDLAVMADQAKGYTEGVIKGNAEQVQVRNDQASRLQEEAAQESAARARAAALDQMQTQEAQLRLTQDAQEASRQLQEARTSSSQIDEAEGVDEKFRQIEFASMSRQKPEFAKVFGDLTSTAVTHRDIMALYDNAVKQGGPDYADYRSVSRDAISRYAQVWEAASANKDISLKSLDRQKQKSSGKKRSSWFRSV